MYASLLSLLGCTAELQPRDVPARLKWGLGKTEDDRIIASDGEAADEFGGAVSGTGDINGDGFDDIIVGAQYNSEGGLRAGAAYVYYGSSSGIAITSEDKLTASDSGNKHLFGGAVSGAGDINGDGYDDVIVGAENDNDVDQSAGSAYIYYGSSSGIVVTSEDKLTASNSASGDRFGDAVAAAGDVNGDGYGDVIVGAYLDQVAGSTAGSAYVYYGSSSGIVVTSEDKLAASDGASGDKLGEAVAGAGDIDGDGYGDVIVGAPNVSAVYVYYGTASGIDSSSETRITSPDTVLQDEFGHTLSGAGDINGDGFDDIIVGAHKDSRVELRAGAAYVYYGTASGISTAETRLTAADGGYSDEFGRAVSGAGDVNGDGYDDVLIGAHGDDDQAQNAGALYLFYGSASGVVATASDKATASDGSGGDYLGRAVSVAGDVNGDGSADLVVGAHHDTGLAASSGAVYLFHGTPDADGDGINAAHDCDDEDATIGSASLRYLDADGDGYGNEDVSASVCPEVSGYTDDATDCDDSDPAVNPSATETCGDGVDSDCDGRGGPDDDEDGDGLTYEEEVALGLDDCDPDASGDDPSNGEDTSAPGEESDKGCTAAPGRPAGWLVIPGLLAGLCRRR